ncbi:methyl-accepting chemotaxis protein [Aneurinibacillus tyrosinisolvens]|uniref:methyl-accepting chemotaxis protein n=1 Tax=Aneurinibacillus tyrosinisolvens TaxID=1443435 RepID=UPI00063F90E1|nr:methyl-accepting chemotaxis protein [Aneurinibacillus tyrosinisolvens]
MRNVFSLKVRSRLIISFLVVLLIPSLAIGWSSYNTSRDKIDVQMTMSSSEAVKLLNSTVDRFIEPEIQNIDYLADRITVGTYKGQEPILRTDILAPFVSKHSEISNIYVGSTEGLFINAPAMKMPEGYDPRQRPWYQEAIKQKGNVIVTSPYISKTTGDFVVAIAKAVKDGSGVLGCEVKLETFAAITKQVKIGTEGYAFILDKGSKVVVHPTTKPTEQLKSDAITKMFQSDSGQFDYVNENKAKKMVFSTNKITGWKIAGTMFSDEVKKEAAPIFYKMILVLFIALIVGVIAVYFIITSITKPLKSLVHGAERIGQGDLTEVIEVKSNDELGLLGNSFNQMAANLREVIRQVGDNAEQVAASAEQLSASAEQTGKATEQIAVTIQEVAAGTDKQTQSVEESSRTIGKLATGVQRIADNAQHVTASAADTSERAEEGAKNIQLAIEQMNAIGNTFSELSDSIKVLGERSNEISQIVQVITDISSQTNLLALNAAIEAARAGEHGKGFAVVADEVRKLAEQSSNSAQQIAQLITAIQEETNKTVQSMDHATKEVVEGIGVVNLSGESFKRIQHSVSEVAGQIEQVSSSVQQISAATEHVVHSITLISEVAEDAAAGTQHVSAATEEQLASMQEISASAASLTNRAEELQEAIGKFKV